MKLTLLDKTYAEEELCDLERDVTECFDPKMNQRAAQIPIDLNCQAQGTFRVTVTWEWEKETYSNPCSKIELSKPKDAVEFE